MNDKEFKKIFISHKFDVPNEGFSERVIRQLHERNNLLPHIVMITFVVFSLVFMFALNGFANFFEQINNLLISVSLMQIPLPSTIITCFTAFALTLFIGFSVAKVDAG